MSEGYRQCGCMDEYGQCWKDAVDGSDFCVDCQPDGGICSRSPRNIESVKEEVPPVNEAPTFTEGYEDLTKREVTEIDAILLKMTVLVRQAKVTEMAEGVAELIGDGKLGLPHARETLYNAILDLAFQLDDAVVAQR